MRRLVPVFLFLIGSLSLGAQKTTTDFTRDQTVTVSSAMNEEGVQAMLGDYERVQLPPLSVFLESVYDHPSIQIYEASRDEEQATMKMVEYKWLDYFRFTASYQYGRMVSLASTSTTDDPLWQSSLGRDQHYYYVGINLTVPFGDLLSQKQKRRVQRANLRRIEYQYEISIEERKLRILEAYNKVVSQLSVLKAKSDAAALYNAQMKISEQDFINGKISIIELSLERGRRSAAVVQYQEGRADLHNSITLLEMLTNIKIMNR
ncbi:TolC family protein [Parabacteroides sp. OttesenSCG-928-N08]|nr:TolC family protein [Parabacteroides sp. OttesenSCG-928-N08]